MDEADKITAAVRAAVSECDGVQLALSGYLIIEVLEEGETEPVLRYYRIGTLSPWNAGGMLRAALRSTDRELDDGYEGDS